MENNKNSINLERFVFVLKRRLIWIVIIALLAGLAAGAVTKLLVKPEYISYATYYVQTTEQQTNTTQQQIAAAKSLVDTYIVFMRGNEFLEDVAASAAEQGVNYTYTQIRARMSASSVSGTEVFKVSISDNDPSTAYIIADAIANKAPAMIENVAGGKVSVIDRPKMPTAPNTTGTKRNAIIGAFLGAAVAFTAFFLSEMFDVTIYTEEDITEEFKYPVIGQIPTITPAQETEKRRSQKNGRDDKTEGDENR